jgi:hypothetical protein
MNGLYTAALEAQAFFQERAWRYCIIGGVALARWGQPRSTQDVDISLWTELGREADYIDPILGRFRGRIADARQFALDHRVLLCQASNGGRLDIILAAFPFEERVIMRATPFNFAAGVSLVTVAAEDLILLKAVADRGQDWTDVRGIIERKTKQLDWDYIYRELPGLTQLSEKPEIVQRLEGIRAEVDPAE